MIQWCFLGVEAVGLEVRAHGVTEDGDGEDNPKPLPSAVAS